jgi:hypothetical protein
MNQFFFIKDKPIITAPHCGKDDGKGYLSNYYNYQVYLIYNLL